MNKSDWPAQLKYDPIKPLLLSGNSAILYHIKKDLQNESVADRSELWGLSLAKSIVKKQQPNGSWRYPSGTQLHTHENHDQIETFRNLGYLVEMFDFTRSSLVIEKAADYLFSFQTEEGDIRGILGNQYGPYYTAAMTELLIKAGYEDDERVHKIFAWLNTMRQDDHGWAIPLRTQNKKLKIVEQDVNTLQPDRSKPSSHLVTGVVLRAYAAHSKYRRTDVAKQAGALLLTRLFSRDTYPDRSDPSFWLKFTFPFWFTDLLSALDSLSLLGFSAREPQLYRAIDWFIQNQSPDGLWHLPTLKNQKKFETELWISLAICRMLQRLL